MLRTQKSKALTSAILTAAMSLSIGMTAMAASSASPADILKELGGESSPSITDISGDTTLSDDGAPTEDQIRNDPGNAAYYHAISKEYGQKGSRGISVFVLGKHVDFSKYNNVLPQLRKDKNGGDRTVVPVKALADALGGSTAWDESTGTVTLTLGDKTIVLKIGSFTATVNGQTVSMDVAAVTDNGRTLIPLRFVSENFGLHVGWFSDDNNSPVIGIHDSEIQ